MILNLNWHTDFSRQSFYVNETNENLLKYVLHQSNIVIIGNDKSGKTHLSNIWQNHVQAMRVEPDNIRCVDYSIPIVVDDLNLFSIDQVNNLIFNAFYNRTPMFLTSHARAYEIYSADIQSRLNSMMHLQIPHPNYDLCMKILIKLAKDRGLILSNDTVSFIMKRIRRSHKSLYECIEKLDKYCLLYQKPPSLMVVSELINMADKI